MIGSDVDYEIKYMKYKKKYLDLQSQVAGNYEEYQSIMKKLPDMRTSIVVTHNARLRCLFDNFFTEYMRKIRDDYNKHHSGEKPIKEIRFKNGCILEWKIDYSEHKVDFRIRMVWSGSVTKKKPGLYFVTKTDAERDKEISEQHKTRLTDIEFPEMVQSKGGTVHTPGLWPINFKLNESDFGEARNHVIYVVRHGESVHNVKSIIPNLKRDTVLTPYGVEETKRTGNELFRIFRHAKYNKIYYFASDLRRTRQTMGIIDDALSEGKIPDLPKEIIIIPCAHELSYIPGGNCDERNINKFVPFENVNTCRQPQYNLNCNNKKLKTTTKLRCCIAGDRDLEVDWHFYNNFYKKNLEENKKGKNYKDKNFPCMNTNMIYQIIHYIRTLPKK